MKRKKCILAQRMNSDAQCLTTWTYNSKSLCIRKLLINESTMDNLNDMDTIVLQRV